MIHGGYILKARKMLESELMDKPPLWSKLWDWMLLRAEWRTGAKLQRGQFITSVDEMREAMSWLVGYRRVTPTKDEIRSAYEGFAKAAMVTTTKTTRGMVVTITNYDTYQSPENYEARDEGRNEKDTKPAVTPYDSKEILSIKNEEKDISGGPAAPIDPKAFSGFVIYHQDGEMRINNRDLESWKSAYFHLDIPAQLQALSDWTRETREWTKKDAFYRTSATLKLRDERARILAEEKRKDEARQDKKPMTIEERKRADWLASGQAVN